VFSQEGEIIGIIVDSKTNETLIGANVVLSGTSIGNSTDIDGKFRLQGIAAGTYDLEISFISYKTKTINNVSVKDNKVTDLGRVFMEEDSQMLEGVTVNERRKTDSELSMISSIQQSKLVVSGVSGEQISRTMDKDAAEVIRRVPGVTIINNRFVIVRGLIDRYNTVHLNNAAVPSSESDKKSFSFDVIPSSALDRLMVYKTPAPELPAEFAGASIEIYTKNLPEENSISIGYKAGFRQETTFSDFGFYEGGKTDWLGYDDGTRGLPENFPSTATIEDWHNWEDQGLPPDEMQAILDAKRANLVATGQSFNKIWDPQYKNAPIDNSLNVDFTKVFKWKETKIGNITSLTYRNEYNTTSIKKGNYSYNEELFVIDTNFIYNDIEYTNPVMIGLLHNWSFNLKNGLLFEFRNLFNQIGESKYTFRDGFDFYREAHVHSHELAYMSRSTYSGQFGVSKTLADDAKLDATFGFAYANRKDPDIRRIYSTENRDSSSVNYRRYNMQFVPDATPELNGRLFLGLEERIWNFGANYSKVFHFGSFHPELKTGLYLETKNRRFSARNIGFVQAKSTSFDQSITYIRPYSDVYADTNINYPYGILLDEKTNADDSYKGFSDLYAGYVGINFPIGARIDFYTGVRIEKIKIKLSGFYKNPDADSLDVILDTLNFFPSANLSFDISEKTKIRLAYGLTTNRPEFREIAPYAYYDFPNAWQMYGNPDLKIAYVQNVDFRFEFYPSPGDLITLGGFYKEFKNPIENTLIPVSTDKWTFKPDNAKSATSLGLEVDFNKSFSNLKDKGAFLRSFRHFNLLLNASYIKSEVKEGKTYVRDEKRPMQGQSPYIINAGLYYNNRDKKLMVSALYNVIGERIIFVGDPNTPHTYEQPRNLLELLISKQIGEHLTIKAGIEDILNETVQFTQEIIFDEDTNEDGVPDTEVKKLQVLREFKPGRKFSLGLTYKF